MTENKRTREELEMEMLEVKIKLKQANLAVKKEAMKKRLGVNQSVLFTLIVAAISVVGTIISSWMQHNNNIRQQQLDMYSSIVLKVIDTDSREKSLRALLFLYEAGLLENMDPRFIELMKDPKMLLKMPALREQAVKRAILNVVDPENQPVVGVDVSVSSQSSGKTNAYGQVHIEYYKGQLNTPDITVKSGNAECKYYSLKEDDYGNLVLMVYCDKGTSHP